MLDNNIDYAPSIHLVWLDPTTNAHVYVGAEDAITQPFLTEQAIEVVITVNTGHTDYPGERPLLTLLKNNPHIQHHNLPFLDAPAKNQDASYASNAADAIQFLINAIREGKRVLVHCRAGIHRSTGVVYNTLIFLGYFDHSYDAQKHMRTIRPQAGMHKSLVKWMRKQHRLKYQASGETTPLEKIK